MSRNIHVFTHSDLDGVGCLLAIIWAFTDYDITYTCVSSASKFKEEFTNFAKFNKIENFNKIFVTDLSLLQEDLTLIDKKNVIYIDHHKTSLDIKLTNAASFIKIYTSCTLLIYKLFKSQLSLNTNQKQLLIYIDDYDSYQLRFNISSVINKLFWAHYVNNVPLFLNDFQEGITEFSPLQKQAIAIQDKKIKNIIQNLTAYKHTTTIQGASRYIVAAFAESSINDVADYILHQHKAEIAIVVNTKTERVSFRRSKDSTVDVAILAQALCGGGGHEASSGGKLSEDFMSFTKLFVPL